MQKGKKNLFTPKTFVILGKILNSQTLFAQRLYFIIIAVFWVEEFYLNNMLLKFYDQEEIQANCLISS